MSGMKLEIWFPQQNEVTVFLESSFVDPTDERLAEILLFSDYACRQIANLNGEYTLCVTLAGIDTDEPLAQVEGLLDGLSVTSPRTRGGARGFTAQFRPGNPFKLKGHGFGLLGKGVGYYAPTSTLALLCWLLRHRDDPDFRRALAVAAATIGEYGRNGMITVKSQAQAASSASMAGIDCIADHSADAEPLDVSDAAAEAIAAHDIDFPELVKTATADLAVLVREVKEELGSQFSVPTEYCMHMCRLYIFAVAVPESDQSYTKVKKALDALEAARETGNPDLIGAAESYSQELLKTVFEAQVLEPLVPELHRRLFTDDIDRAA